MLSKFKKVDMRQIGREAGQVVVPIGLPALYEATALSLLIPIAPNERFPLSADLGKSFANPRVKPFLEAMENCGGDLPLAFNGRRTLSGMELFHRVGNVPAYYPSRADTKIHDDNLDYLASLLKDATVVDLCAGHSLKTVQLLQKIPETHRPKQICVNDIFPENIDISIANLVDIGFSKNRIFRAEGDILNKKKVWYPLGGKLRSSPSQKTVVMMQGATFNDFTTDEMRKILRHFHLLPKGTVFLISIDNTTDEKTLRNAYDHAQLKQLALAGVESFIYNHSRGIPGFNRDLPALIAHADSSVPIETRDDAATISLSVRLGNYLFPYEPAISKISVSETSKMYAEQAHILLGRLPFTDPGRFPTSNYAIYVSRADHNATPPVP